MDPRQHQKQQQYSPRPVYPVTAGQQSSSSTSSSVFQSSSSLTSISSLNTTGQASQMSTGSAPMPSPSGQPNAYFSSIASQQRQTSHPAPSQQQQQQMPAQLATSPQFVGQRGDGQGLPATTPFLQDFNLVAEAAKRAQMACLARDLGDFGL